MSITPIHMSPPDIDVPTNIVAEHWADHARKLDRNLSMSDALTLSKIRATMSLMQMMSYRNTTTRYPPLGRPYRPHSPELGKAHESFPKATTW